MVLPFRRMKVVIAGIAAVLAMSGVAEAQPRLVASAVDSGDLPFAYASGWLYHPKRAPRIVVKAWPAAVVEVGLDVQCSRGVRKRAADWGLSPQPAPLDRRIRLTMRQADDCYVSVTAGYQDFEQAGRIAVAVYR